MNRWYHAAIALACMALSPWNMACATVRTDPNAVVFDAALANRFVPATAASNAIVRVHIGASTQTPARRPVINVALVVDTSGSMEGQPIADARTAALAAVNSLADGDIVSVVVFHSTAEVLVPATTLTARNRASVQARVRSMRALGTTNMSSGMSLGLQEATRRLQRDGVNRIVLLSDGIPNDAASLESLARSAGSRGIAITSLGLGLDYHETLMAAIARASGGRFHYIQESSQVATVFRDEVMRMQRLVARNAFMVLRPGPGVRIERVVGHAATATGAGSMRVALGDVSESEGRDLIVRLNVAGRRAGASVELMDAVLSFEGRLAGSDRRERQLFVGARATNDDNELTTGRNAEVERDAARIEAAAATVAAVELARRGDVANASQNLERAEHAARASGRANHDDVLLAQAQSMNELRGALPSAVARAADTSVAAEAGIAAQPAAVLRRAHDRAVQTSEGY